MYKHYFVIIGPDVFIIIIIVNDNVMNLCLTPLDLKYKTICVCIYILMMPGILLYFILIMYGFMYVLSLLFLLLYCCFLCIVHSFSCATCTCHAAVTYLDLFPPVLFGTSVDEPSPSGPIFRIYFGIIIVDFNFLLGLPQILLPLSSNMCYLIS